MSRGRWCTQRDVLNDLTKATGRKVNGINKNYFVYGEEPPPPPLYKEDDEMRLHLECNSRSLNENVLKPDLRGIIHMLRLVKELDPPEKVKDLNPHNSPPKLSSDNSISKLNPNVKEFIPSWVISKTNQTQDSNQSEAINDINVANNCGGSNRSQANLYECNNKLLDVDDELIKAKDVLVTVIEINKNTTVNKDTNISLIDGLVQDMETRKNFTINKANETLKEISEIDIKTKKNCIIENDTNVSLIDLPIKEFEIDENFIKDMVVNKIENTTNENLVDMLVETVESLTTNKSNMKLKDLLVKNMETNKNNPINKDTNTSRKLVKGTDINLNFTTNNTNFKDKDDNTSKNTTINNDKNSSIMNHSNNRLDLINFDLNETQEIAAVLENKISFIKVPSPLQPKKERNVAITNLQKLCSQSNQSVKLIPPDFFENSRAGGYKNFDKTLFNGNTTCINTISHKKDSKQQIISENITSKAPIIDDSTKTSFSDIKKLRDYGKSKTDCKSTYKKLDKNCKHSHETLLVKDSEDQILLVNENILKPSMPSSSGDSNIDKDSSKSIPEIRANESSKFEVKDIKSIKDTVLKPNPSDPQIQSSIKKVTSWLNKEGKKPKGPRVYLGPVAFKRKDTANHQSSNEINKTIAEPTFSTTKQYVPSKYAVKLSMEYEKRVKDREMEKEKLCNFNTKLKEIDEKMKNKSEETTLVSSVEVLSLTNEDLIIL